MRCTDWGSLMMLKEVSLRANLPLTSKIEAQYWSRRTDTIPQSNFSTNAHGFVLVSKEYRHYSCNLFYWWDFIFRCKCRWNLLSLTHVLRSSPERPRSDANSKLHCWVSTQVPGSPKINNMSKITAQHWEYNSGLRISWWKRRYDCALISSALPQITIQSSIP